MKERANIQIYNENCLPAMRKMKDNEFDLAIVDPPYGIGINKMKMGGRKTTPPTEKVWDKNTPSKDYFKELFRVSKNQIIWGGNYFNLPISRYFAIWDKGETMYGRDFAECEMAWVRSGGTKIFKKSPNQLDRIHPTQKPVALYKWLLKNYANTGDRILDTHLGSGSIAIACWDMRFDLVGYELDKDYYKAAMKRFEIHKAQLQLF